MSDDPFDARRRIERRTVTLNGLAKGSHGPATPVTLLNLSPLGFRARGASGLVPGDHFRFDLPSPFDSVAKVVWIDGEEFGGEFPTFLPLSGLHESSASPTVAETSQPGAAGHGFRIEYGPPDDRRIVDCPNALYAAEWYGEIISAGLPFVRILNAQGDVVRPEYLQQLLAG
jgi:hypothetical protein